MLLNYIIRTIVRKNPKKRIQFFSLKLGNKNSKKNGLFLSDLYIGI